MNWKNILRVYGFLLLLLAASMIPSLLWALYYGTPDWRSFLLSMPIVGIPGYLLWRRKGTMVVETRDSFLIVTGGWIISAFAAAVPFILSGVLPRVEDALFETMSGFTTTGATVMPIVEVPAAGILFWRSYLNWLGGMGIVLIFLAFMPKSGLGGAFLFRAEVPGLEVERLTPRLRQTAAYLLAIYTGMTLLQTVLLVIAGMSPYEALIHTFSSVATGGFSSRNQSVGAFSNVWTHYIILFFMFFAGANFSLYYKAIVLRKPKAIFLDKEFQAYFGIVLVATLVIGINLFRTLGAGEALRQSSFQVVSVITTTGFTTANFDKWPDLSRAVLLALMFIGPSSGSTGGSIKVVRYIVVVKSIFREFSKMIHARAVLPLRIGDHVVPEGVVRTCLVFMIAYLLCAAVGTFYLLALGMDMVSSLSAVAATLGNIGPGLGVVGPAFSFAVVPASGKVLLTFLMLVGRLEVFTVFVTMAPPFWKR